MHMNKKSYITTGSFLVPFSMNPPPFQIVTEIHTNITDEITRII